MKQLKLFLVALMCLLTSTAAFADDKPIPVEQLPTAAKTFVQQHFPKNKILSAEKDSKSYEARLDNGVEVEFDKKGAWKKVDCHQQAVPAAVVPANIATYVKTNYAGSVITKIEKERYGYEVELSNDIELKFNKSGALIGVDD